MTRDLSVKLDATTGVHAESWQPGPGEQVGVERLSAADLALATDFAGIPPELRAPLAAVMVQRKPTRLSANLEALGAGQAVLGVARRNRALEAGGGPVGVTAEMEPSDHLGCVSGGRET